MLRHAPIRSKVVAILTLPLVGLIALAAVGIGTTLARGAEADRRNDLAQLAVRGNTLVHELQAERTLSSDWVAARPSQAVPRDGMLAQRVVVDRTASALEQFVGRLDTDAYDPRVRQALDRALGELRQLQADREVIDIGASSPTAAAVEATYSAVVSALLDLNAAIAAGSDDEALFRSVSSFVALSRLKNTTDLERGFQISELLAPTRSSSRSSASSRSSPSARAGSRSSGSTPRQRSSRITRPASGARRPAASRGSSGPDYPAARRTSGRSAPASSWTAPGSRP